MDCGKGFPDGPDCGNWVEGDALSVSKVEGFDMGDCAAVELGTWVQAVTHSEPARRKHHEPSRSIDTITPREDWGWRSGRIKLS